jgi:hypothetical protein
MTWIGTDFTRIHIIQGTSFHLHFKRGWRLLFQFFCFICTWRIHKELGGYYFKFFFPYIWLYLDLQPISIPISYEYIIEIYESISKNGV